MILRLALVGCSLAVASAASGPSDVREYLGCCDASAAVPIDDDRFVVGDDETNVLRVYSREHGGPPQIGRASCRERV